MRAAISLKSPIYSAGTPRYTILAESVEVNDQIVVVTTGVGLMTVGNGHIVSLLEVDTQDAFDALVADADAFTLVL